MGRTGNRSEESYQAFLAYIQEAGLLIGMREICLKYAVTVRDIYLDVRGLTVHAARMEVWFWLSFHWGKSGTEISRLFDREQASINHALQRLRERATAQGVPLNLETVSDVARSIVNETKIRWAR